MAVATTERTGAAMAEWSDGRLDEFAVRIDERFDRVDEKFEEVDRRFDKVDRRFDEADQRFNRVDDRLEAGFNRVNDRLDDLVKVLIAGIIAFTAAILAGFGAILVLIATQL
jgi:hypothetical protein